jgi:MoxR-like ATPase
VQKGGFPVPARRWSDHVLQVRSGEIGILRKGGTGKTAIDQTTDSCGQDSERRESPMFEKIDMDGVLLTLAAPDTHESHWIDSNDYLRQLGAAWLRLSDDELPLNPRIVGEPGLGKTTLACAAARGTGRDVYIFQCTMDTRPEDLVITPVLTGDKQIEYRASAVVTAMIRGGVVLLDEANRMPERSWASLAPLMDDRRYIESEVAALKIQAHPNFRLAVTMNSDASVYELPSRPLQPL